MDNCRLGGSGGNGREIKRKREREKAKEKEQRGGGGGGSGGGGAVGSDVYGEKRRREWRESLPPQIKRQCARYCCCCCGTAANLYELQCVAVCCSVLQRGAAWTVWFALLWEHRHIYMSDMPRSCCWHTSQCGVCV